MDCFYNNDALTEVAYDYETNTITAKCGGLNVTMVWREEDNTISFTAVDDEQRMWDCHSFKGRSVITHKQVCLSAGAE